MGQKLINLGTLLGGNRYLCYDLCFRLPISGLSEVTGIIEDTVFRNIVRERRIVTPEKEVDGLR